MSESRNTHTHTHIRYKHTHKHTYVHTLTDMQTYIHPLPHTRTLTQKYYGIIQRTGFSTEYVIYNNSRMTTKYIIELYYSTDF